MLVGLFSSTVVSYNWDRVTTGRRNVNDALYESLHDDNFCVIDGMDSAKTILPHLHQFDKDVLTDKCLKIHITCMKYNGARPDGVYYFTGAFLVQPPRSIHHSSRLF